MQFFSNAFITFRVNIVCPFIPFGPRIPLKHEILENTILTMYVASTYPKNISAVKKTEAKKVQASY